GRAHERRRGPPHPGRGRGRSPAAHHAALHGAGPARSGRSERPLRPHRPVLPRARTRAALLRSARPLGQSGVGPQPPADLRPTGSLRRRPLRRSSPLPTAPPSDSRTTAKAPTPRSSATAPPGPASTSRHPPRRRPLRRSSPPPTAPPSDSRTTAKTPAPRSSATVLPGPATVGSAPSTGSPAASTATRAPSTDSPGSNRATTPTTARPLRTRPTIRAEALLPPDGIDRGFAL